MKMLVRTGLLFALLAAPALAGEEDSITMIGLDAKGSPVEVLLKKKEYSQRLAVISQAVNESAVLAMAKQEDKPGWGLRTFAVGIGAGLEAGLGPVIKVKITPRFRLVFTNMAEPILP